MPIIFIAGNVESRSFQEARMIMQDLAACTDKLQYEFRPLAEADWLEYLIQKRRELGGKAFQHISEDPLVIHSIHGYLGGVDGLVAHGEAEYDYEDPRKDPSYATLVTEELKKDGDKDFGSYMSRAGHSYAYFDFAVGGSSHRLVFELFTDKCPKTCANFLALCTGEKDGNLHYKGTPFHRVVKDGWVQGGDVVTGKGTGSTSIYGETFADESFVVKHDAPGTLSMASKGPHTNGCQFFITLRPMPFFDKKRVAFGRVVSGLRGLKLLNEVETVNERPKTAITIADCGKINPPPPEKPSLRPPSTAKASKEATILVIGLDGAGKSTVVNKFVGRDQDVSPTVGFESSTTQYGDFNVKFYSVGGGPTIREIWPNYYDDVSGVVYVVDSSDANKLKETAAAAQTAFAHAKLGGKPVAIFLNKHDRPKPLSGAEVALELKLGDDATKKIFNTTALVKNDPGMDEGMTWLLVQIARNYTALQTRVANDVAAKKVQEAEERRVRSAKRQGTA